MSADAVALRDNHLARLLELLRNATDEKLMKGRTSEAIQLARKAREIARRHLRSPWDQITAYRLAHLLMRTGDNLDEAEELFALASVDDGLGPAPRIYRLAVLHRLGRCAERDVVEAQQRFCVPRLAVRDGHHPRWAGSGVQDPFHNVPPGARRLLHRGPLPPRGPRRAVG